jgi:uncharacterized membrane protein
MQVARHGSHIKESSMQQYSTHRSSSTPLLIAAVGVGALLAYALASPRRRAALLTAGHTAIDAGSRLAATSAERLRQLIPEPTQDAAGRLAAQAEQAAGSATSSAAERLHHAVDRASELMHEAVTRARRLPASARREAREPWHGLRESVDDRIDGGMSGRAATGGVILAAAAVGAGLYAWQRYGVSDRLRERLGADGSGTITLDKTIYIDAPIEHVFDTWADYENFPRFMSNVKNVQPLGGDRSHWTVRGPAGIGVAFDSVAQMQRPTELAWESEPGSRVQTNGRVMLVPEGAGTRANVHLCYRPPAGAMGQAVSSLLGADPKREFDDDLNRMKGFIESRRLGAQRSSASTTSAAGSTP